MVSGGCRLGPEVEEMAGGREGLQMEAKLLHQVSSALVPTAPPAWDKQAKSSQGLAHAWTHVLCMTLAKSVPCFVS